jgi:alcohol dehydrogenase class IV
VNTDHIPGLVALPFEHLPETISSTGVAFVTDSYLARLPLIEPVIAAIPNAEVIVIPVGEPTAETIDSVAVELAHLDARTVVGFGGGSAIDTAKLAALVAATGTDVDWHLGVVRPVAPALDVLAVPTTSGSGAEVTRTCVVSRDGRKSWAWNDSLRPHRVIVDPQLTHGLPQSVTVSTGLDALVHALEAATAPDAETAAIDSGAAALEAIIEALPAAVADGSDGAARAEMLDAALCAGFAIDLAGTGIGHGVGHALASMLTVPHGLAVAFGMWSCLEWSIQGAPDRYGRVDGDDDLYRRVAALLETVGLHHRLRRWANKPLDAAAFADELSRDEHRPMCLNNARPVVGDDIDVVARLVTDAWNLRFA